jgi:hypothetical protein
VGAHAQLKYHYFYRFFTYSVKRRAGRKSLVSGIKCPASCRARSALKTVSGGEFDWGGTSVKR